jgi:hypothetical protein
MSKRSKRSQEQAGFTDAGKEHSKSWLVHEDIINQVHKLVESNIQKRMNRGRGGFFQIPSQSVEALCEDIKKGLDVKRWFLALCACSILAELIYCTLDRRKPLSDFSEMPVRSANERDILYESLASLRNACFHPALIKDRGQKRPLPMHSLVKAVKRSDPQLSDRLAADWSLLRSEEILAWAIRQLDQAVRHDMKKK